jgi:hypothetical protein
VAHACNPGTQEAEIRKIKVQSQPLANKLQNPISKIPNTKRTGRVGRVLEWLLSKCEALSSKKTPVPPPPTKKENAGRKI